MNCPPGKKRRWTISKLGHGGGNVIADAVWFEKVSAAATPVEKLATKPLSEEQNRGGRKPQKSARGQAGPKERPEEETIPSKPQRKIPKEPEKKPTPPGERFVWLDKPVPKLKKLDADKLDALIESQLAGMTLAEKCFRTSTSCGA